MMLASQIHNRFNRQLWTPAKLTVLPAVWSNDQSLQTLVSGVVSDWRGNSPFGLAYDTSLIDVDWNGASGAVRPTPISEGATDSCGSKRTLQFDGSSDYLSDAQTGMDDLFRNTAAGWFFAVMKKSALDGSSTGRCVFYGATNAAANSRFQINLGITTDSTKNKFQMRVRRTDAESIKKVTDPSELADTNFHIFMATMDWTNRTGRLYIDGVEVASDTALTAAGGNTSDTAAAASAGIGAVTNSPAQWADIVLGEIMLGRDSLPSTDERYRLEGYAAWRWGLQANLPGGHAYEDAPPLPLPWT